MASSDVTEAPAQKRLEGIGGWLILLAIGQVVGPLQTALAIYREYAGMPAGTFARYPLAVSVQFLLLLAFLGLLVYAAYLFFNKRAAFPNVYIAAVAAGLVLPFVLGVWTTLSTGINTFRALGNWDFMGYYLLTVVVGLLWISYLLNSVRVRNTFVQ